MDRMICRFDAVNDNDLMLCLERGVAYQRNMSIRVEYAKQYFDNYVALEGKEIAKKLNAGRVALVERHTGVTPALDIGVGSGEFVKTRASTFGYDINYNAVRWLKQNGRYSDDFRSFKVFTFWDVIEHVEDINHYFRRVAPGSFVFTSLPIFDDLRRIRKSKHYKPGEHLYYWTKQGFVDWMALYGFKLLEADDFETKAGRESIVSFAFQRILPGYHETLEQYQKIYSAVYGASSMIYFDHLAPIVVDMDPKSILDFGCGRSDLVSYFWKDGERKIAKYDPAIPLYKKMPDDGFDLVICNDVMEHILMHDVDKIFNEIREKSKKVIFTISLRPAKAHLPDGRNAHVTLLSESEWTRWVKSAFGTANKVPLPWDHLLMLKTF